METNDQPPGHRRGETETIMASHDASIRPEHRTEPAAVPGSFVRALVGITVRNGTFYWSGASQFWRITLLFFTIKLLLRIAFNPPGWRAEPEWLGIPFLSMPYAGVPALSSLFFAGLLTVLAIGRRRRFNQAALPAPGSRS
jgi:hypothetical protein